ncbi:hypothetical protein DNTS_009177, partial [Danionella cerebrum]
MLYSHLDSLTTTTTRGGCYLKPEPDLHQSAARFTPLSVCLSVIELLIPWLGMFATHRSSLTDVRVVHHGRRLSRQLSVPSEPLQVPKNGPPGSSVRRSSSISSSKLLSLSFSESMRSDIDRYLSDQGLCPLRQPGGELGDIRSLREVRAAAQLKNLEDFLRTNGVSLQETISFQTGM